MDSAKIDYAKASGFHSEAAAIVYAILYVPLAVFYIYRSFSRPTYVHFFLAFFCHIRIATFVLRAVLISIQSVGETLGALVADEILLEVGFFGLLYSSYTLVLDLEWMTNYLEPQHRIIILTRFRLIFRIIIFTALAFVAVSLSTAQKDGTLPGSAKSSLLVGTIIFLVLAALQAVQTLNLAYMKIKTQDQVMRSNEQLGSRHAMVILSIAAVLLLVREAFLMATVNNSTTQNLEHFWHPLIATPEILVAILFTTPGLVPKRREIYQRRPRGFVYIGAMVRITSYDT